MDDWTHPYPVVVVPDERPSLLFEDERVREACRVPQAARVAELTQAVDVVGVHAEADVPQPFATPPGAALTF
jgi:hypothetical protein